VLRERIRNRKTGTLGNSGRYGIRNDWYERLSDQFDAPYFVELREFIQSERSKFEIYPPEIDVFSALNETSYADTRVVILGQDPYHGPGQAHGLCFSVQRDVAVPPSLANIFVELENDLGIPRSPHGCLLHWAQQGVLLLNTTLTVRRGEAGSHHAKGWERFTDHIISLVNDKPEPVVFVLWGNPARRKKALIAQERHVIIEAPHPSPLSAHRGFFGSRPFSAINTALAQQGLAVISWDINSH
jgi:uracil-DNA glycosylase